MKRIRYFIAIVALFCGLAACKKDFLEVIDKTVLLKEGYVIDLETTGQFLNGVYIDLAANYAHGNFLPYPEIMSDNMKPAKTKVFTAAYNWSFTPDQQEGIGDPILFWTKYYAMVRNCSFVIEKAGEFHDQNVNKANNMQGQAFAIRAMLHFTLVNMFAQSYNFTPDASHIGIPCILTSDIESTVSRQTVAQVYAAIITDLDKALQILPKTGFVKDVMNYQAAKALLARVYLFKEDYQNAKNLSLQVLTDVPIMTTNYPANLYTNNDSEVLFRMPPGAIGAPVNYVARFIGYYGSQAGGLSYVATNDIAQLLKEDLNDKRNAWVKDTLKAWQIRKFPRGVAGLNPTPDGDYYQSIFRSSEMCLTAAEAYEKLNRDDSARFYIDIIRKRANSTAKSINAVGEVLLDSICKERRKEMAFDGLRMFDLLRWKKGVNRLDANNPASQTLSYPNNKAIAALPRSDVSISGLQQNPDY